jgi:uncharacterized membrane protein (UPF0127 family)
LIKFKLLILLLVLTSILMVSDWISPISAEQCQLDNPALQEMSAATVVFKRQDSVPLRIDVRLANTMGTRAAGFQRVCASVIASKPILFLFAQERLPSFHMHNVVAPIDIAFISKSGLIDTFHAMQPYSMVSIERPLYSPKRPVIAALETQPGFFEDNNIDHSTQVSWEIGD